MAKKVTSRVERILKSSQKYRDSDKELLLAVWEEEGLYFSETQKTAFKSCSPAESITRTRRALKNEYPASKKIDNAHYKLFKQTRNEYSQGIQWWRG